MTKEVEGEDVILVKGISLTLMAKLIGLVRFVWRYYGFWYRCERNCSAMRERVQLRIFLLT